MRWVIERVLERRCPACGRSGAKRARIEVQSPFRGAGLLNLLDCHDCTSQFFDDQSLPPEDYEDHAAAVKFYVHQGAGIDHMIFPLLRVPAERVQSMAEIGCGFGFALDFARTTLGWRVRGIDHSKAAQAGARALGLDIVPAYFEGPSSLDGETFDVVFCSEVIEHVPDPNAFAHSIAAILAPHGVSIFTTPNAAAVRPDQSEGDLLRVLSPGFHLTLFTARSLRMVLERAGFSHILIEEEADSLKAYASRAPLDLVPFAPRAHRLYRRYLTVRGGATDLDADLRLGLQYRHFKTLVNAGAWPDAEAQFVELRVIVRDRYGFDLERPETVPTPPRLPSGRPVDLHEARVHLEAFLARVPANIVGLLYFRGSLALCTGRALDAMAFFRAVGKIGMVARSLQHSLANDGETADLFTRSFMLGVLASAHVAPDDAVARLARIMDGEPPDDVPRALWTFTAEEREWLLVTLFGRLVDLGHRAQAELVYDRIRECFLAAYGLDPGGRPSPAHHDEVSDDRPLPRGLAGVLFGRGLLELVAGRSPEALAFFDEAAGVVLASPVLEGEPPGSGSESASVFMRIQIHTLLALSDVDADAALALRGLLEGTRPATVPPALWNAAAVDRRELLYGVFARLVNAGSYSHAATLASAIEAMLGAAIPDAPDPLALAAGADSVLDAAFCRAMLALNHEQAHGTAAAWFGAVYDAACERWRTGTASSAAASLLWTARYHEALARARADDVQAAGSIVEDMTGERIDGLPAVPEPLAIAGRALVLARCPSG